MKVGPGNPWNFLFRRGEFKSSALVKLAVCFEFLFSGDWFELLSLRLVVRANFFRFVAI